MPRIEPQMSRESFKVYENESAINAITDMSANLQYLILFCEPRPHLLREVQGDHVPQLLQPPLTKRQGISCHLSHRQDKNELPAISDAVLSMEMLKQWRNVSRIESWFRVTKAKRINSDKNCQLESIWRQDESWRWVQRGLSVNVSSHRRPWAVPVRSVWLRLGCERHKCSWPRLLASPLLWSKTSRVQWSSFGDRPTDCQE